MGTCHSRRRPRETPTYKTKGIENMDNLRTTSVSRKQRRKMERRRKTPGSGATSIRSLGTTLLIAPQRSHWWLR